MSVETNSAEDLQKVESEEAKLIDPENSILDSSSAIGFLEAWKIPGVAPFAFCLFFSKFVAYTFLYWLPFYIRHTGNYWLPFKLCHIELIYIIFS
jgi:OPA family glycerol-3-phosphate transporter-like MFS transporter 1/2